MSKRDVEIMRVDQQAKGFLPMKSTPLGDKFKEYLRETDWEGFDLNELRAVHKFLEDLNTYVRITVMT